MLPTTHLLGEPFQQPFTINGATYPYNDPAQGTIRPQPVWKTSNLKFQLVTLSYREQPSLGGPMVPHPRIGIHSSSWSSSVFSVTPMVIRCLTWIIFKTHTVPPMGTKGIFTYT